MRIMSVDYGDVRTGIAFCDITQTLVSPYCVIKESDAQILAEKIKEIADREHPLKIVVGLPRNMDGSYGYRCDECKEFAQTLKQCTGIDVDYEDERLTTVMAHDILSQNNVRGKKRKAVVDAVSAVMILESYLERNK